MSIFTDNLYFSEVEQQDTLCRQISFLSRYKWNPHAVFQAHRVPQKTSKKVIDLLSKVSDVIEHSLVKDPFIKEARLMGGLRALFPDVTPVALAAIVREYIRATPPPYAMSRQFEQWREMVTRKKRDSVVETVSKPEKLEKPKKRTSTRKKKV